MISNNVVTFPKQYNGPKVEVISSEDIERNLDMMKHYHIQETIANLTPMIFTQLEISGFSFGGEEDDDDDIEDGIPLENIKDGAFIIEALRSLMCKHYGIYHPFQQISEHVFHQDDIELGALKIADSLNIELKNVKVETEEDI